jgi:hypothetical protein
MTVHECDIDVSRSLRHCGGCTHYLACGWWPKSTFQSIIIWHVFVCPRGQYMNNNVKINTVSWYFQQHLRLANGQLLNVCVHLQPTWHRCKRNPLWFVLWFGHVMTFHDISRKKYGDFSCTKQVGQDHLCHIYLWILWEPVLMAQTYPPVGSKSLCYYTSLVVL